MPPPRWDYTQLQVQRLRKNWSETKLAAEIGVVAETVRNWERGSTEPSASMICAIIRALGCPPEDLLETLEPAKRKR